MNDAAGPTVVQDDEQHWDEFFASISGNNAVFILALTTHWLEEGWPDCASVCTSRSSDPCVCNNTHPDSCTHMDRTGLEFNFVFATQEQFTLSS